MTTTDTTSAPARERWRVYAFARKGGKHWVCVGEADTERDAWRLAMELWDTEEYRFGFDWRVSKDTRNARLAAGDANVDLDASGS